MLQHGRELNGFGHQFPEEAGAGQGNGQYGKRMVALITSGKYTVDQIVAITYP